MGKNPKTQNTTKDKARVCLVFLRKPVRGYVQTQGKKMAITHVRENSSLGHGVGIRMTCFEDRISRIFSWIRWGCQRGVKHDTKFWA